jgi:hypothetical protein
MMRHGFGGHPFGPHEAEQRERREGRVGDIYRDDIDGEAALGALSNPVGRKR